jgi:hypothetical protein
MQPHPLLKVIVTVGALALAALHVRFPNLPIDAITLALIAVAVLPWLQAIFKTIKFPGGFEVTLQELKQGVKNATGVAQSAEQKADLAVSTLNASQPNPSLLIADSSAIDRLLELARVYENIRNRQTSSAPRTEAMTAIVRDMISLAPSLRNLDPSAMLRAPECGQRLAAYALLYAKPDPKYLSELVFSVTIYEDKPFGQYWGLQAIGRTLDSIDRISIADSVVRDLSSYAERVSSGSDRGYEVRKILDRLTRA